MERQRAKQQQTQTNKMDKQSSKDSGEEEESSQKGADSPKDSSEPGSHASSSPPKPGVLGLRPNKGDKKANDGMEGKGASVASSSAEGGGETKASETSSGGGKAPVDGSLPKKPKKDRSNLRKGKWTVRYIQIIIFIVILFIL